MTNPNRPTPSTVPPPVRRHPGPALPATGDPERGDVPGWVLVTLMSALIIVALIAGFQGQLAAAFSNAISSVSGAGGG